MNIILRILRYNRQKYDPLLLWGSTVIGFICLCLSLFLYQDIIVNNLGVLGIIFMILGFSIVGGNHRLLSHNSWPCPRYLRNLISLIATLGLQGAPMAWVALHREHHRYTDTKEDPHSPSFMGRVHVQFGLKPLPNLKYAMDLWRDPWQRFLFDYYWVINFTVLSILLFLGPMYFIIWMSILCLKQQVTFLVNSVTHDTPWYWFPTREKISGDKSRNVFIVALLTGGEGWHLNHHREPQKWFFGKKWWQVDLAGMQIFCLILLTNPGYFFKNKKLRKINE